MEPTHRQSEPCGAFFLNNPLKPCWKWFETLLTPSLGGAIYAIWASQVALVLENRPTNAGDLRDAGPVPWLGTSPGERSGNPLQNSCLKNPMDRGAWCVRSMGSQGVWHGWSEFAHTQALMPRELLIALACHLPELQICLRHQMALHLSILPGSTAPSPL